MEPQLLLQQIGFKDKKAKAYLACLELGEAQAQKIAQKADLERTSIYAILESLKQDGLITSTVKKKTLYFIAEPPQKLVEVLQDKSQIISQSLPLFLDLYKNSSNKPKIYFYDEKEGVKKILNDALTSKEKMLRNFSSIKDLEELIGRESLIHFVEKRVKLGISIKSLRPQEKESPEWYFKAANKDTLRTSRFLPKEITFDTVCLIYDNKVALISSKKECFGFIVESKDFSNMMKTLFDFIWMISDFSDYEKVEGRNIKNL